MIKRILLSLALVCSSVAGGQSVTQLPRSSPADSTLFLCSDSTKTVTRACKFSDVQKRLAFKTFDSLVTGNIRITGTCAGCGGNVIVSDTVRQVTFDSVRAVRVRADTLRASAGASKRLVVQTTTSGSALTTAVRFNEAQQSLFADGTFSRPGISFASDSLTGVWKSGNGVTIGTAGAGYAFTNNAGVVQLRGQDGTAANPSYTWGSSPTTGVYRFGADTLGFSALGRVVATVADSQVRVVNGRVGKPSYSFVADGTSGWYWQGSQMNAAIAGTNRLGVTATSVNALGVGFLTNATTTAGAPAFGMTSPATGFFFSGAADTIFTTFSGTQGLAVSGGATAKLTGGAGNMTIQSGTGNSRTMTLQTTTSAGTVRPTMALADTSVTLLGHLLTNGNNGENLGSTTNSWGTGFINKLDARNVNGMTITGGAGTSQANMTILAGTGTAGTMVLQSSNSTGVATTFATGSGDTLKTVHIIAVGLTAASGTPNSLCLVSATKQVTENAATSCVVSSIRFKKDTAALSTSEARRIISKLTPETFTYKDGGRKAIGLIAEQVDTVDHRLTFKNPNGELNSVDYQALGPILIKIVQDQQHQLDSIKTILKARKP